MAENTYGQILKSSAVIGGASVLTIAIGMVRTKAMALLLGPAGIGLFGLYGSIVDLAVSIAGLGVNSSGVRQIAEAVGSKEPDRVARIAAVLRRTSVVLGVVGAALLVAFSALISRVTFGNEQHTLAVALLSLVVFCRLVADGRSALLQGMRRIADLAKANVLASVSGVLVTILMVYALGEDGVVPALVLGSFVGLMIVGWYAAKVRVAAAPSMPRAQVGRDLSALLTLGVAFMASGVMVMGVAYAVRIFVTREAGIDAAGLYQCAWTLGGLYVGLIVQAMGTDFYPRLTAVARDDAACNRVVNEQTEISLWLAGPGVLATLTFAPLIIFIFYSSSFDGAVPVLRWFCLGVALRVFSWPMGYILIAKGARRVFMLSDGAWTAVHVALAWVFVRKFGLEGAGIAFFGSYVFQCFLNYSLVSPLSGFRWSAANQRAGGFFIGLMAVVFGGFLWLPSAVALGLGTVAVALSGYVSLRAVVTLVPPDKLPKVVVKPLAFLRLAPRMNRR